jgi:hypothetical protein
MAVLRLKLDSDHVHLRIFDEKNECLAEVNGKITDNKVSLAEIGRSYNMCLNHLRLLIFSLENPKSIIDGLKIGYEYTRDR